MNCIYLAQNGDRWQAVVNALINFGFYKIQGICVLNEDRLSSQEGLRSIEEFLYEVGLTSGR